MRWALLLLVAITGIVLVKGTLDVRCDKQHDVDGYHRDGSSHSSSKTGSSGSSSSKSGSKKTHGSGSKSSSSKSHGSGSKSDSNKSHGSGSKSDSSKSHGSGSKQTQHHEKGNKKFSVRPKCCDLCDLLSDSRSEYYQKCGKYLSKSEQYANKRMCKKQYQIGNEDDLRRLTMTFRKECFQKFASMVDFDCLPNDVSKSPSFNGFCKSKYVKDICGTRDKFCPKPRQCDECRSLIEGDSQFNKVCGNSMADDVKELLYWRCSSACDEDERRAVFAQIVGYCACYEPKVPIDFCKMA